MSDVKIQKVANTTDRTLPIFKETEDLMRRVRECAFNLFSCRGFSDGHALEDWLAAEHELCWPAAELVEHDKDFVLSIAVPGFEPGDIAITATPRELIVHAKSQRSAESKKDEQAVWSEFRANDVYRRIELEKDIDVEKVSASLKNGMLKVVAAKAKAPEKSIPVAIAA